MKKPLALGLLVFSGLAGITFFSGGSFRAAQQQHAADAKRAPDFSKFISPAWLNGLVKSTGRLFAPQMLGRYMESLREGGFI